MTPATPPRDTDSFAAQAEGRQTGILSEFWQFLRQNRKFWLIPILVILALFALLLLSSPAVAPFIYTLF